MPQDMIQKVLATTSCEDGSCCCLPPKCSVALISILSLMVCVVDLMTMKAHMVCCSMKEYLECARHVLQYLFQIANCLLIMSVILDNATLVNIYLCYALSYVVMGLSVSILELLCRFVHEGVGAVAIFFSEVLFYFVLSRCLSIVNSFKKQLEETASRNSFQ